MNKDTAKLARVAISWFEALGLKLVTVESCTGGLVAAALTDIPGSSAVLERGFVVYSNAAKTDLVGVDPDLIAAHGAVSEAVADAMAQGGFARSRADAAIAVTGIAGPGGGSALKPEGRVCFAAAMAGRRIAATEDFGAIGRAAVRRAAVAKALRLCMTLTLTEAASG